MAECAGAGLALALPAGVFAQAGEVLPAHSIGRHMLFQSASAAVVDHDFQVHLGLAAQLVDVAEELAVVGGWISAGCRRR